MVYGDMSREEKVIEGTGAYVKMETHYHCFDEKYTYFHGTCDSVH